MRLINLQKHFIATIITMLTIIFLVGCDLTDDDNDEETSGSETNISVALSGMQSVPMQTSNATGVASLTVNTESGAISGSVDISDLASGNAVSNVHLHSGLPGETGEIIMTLEQDGVDANTWNFPASSILSMDELESVLSGGTYLNVHTTSVVSGELRGQVLPTNYETVVTTLSGDLQVPAPVASTLIATAYSLINTSTGMLQTRLLLSDVTDVTNAHIHKGVAGTNGDIVTTLTANASDASIYEVETVLSSTHQSAYSAGELYLNVHTSTNAAGELRGQLLPDNIVMMRSSLSSDQVTESVTSSASGIGYITVNTTSGAAVSNIQLSDISDVTLVHIHEGAAGTTGDVVLTFSSTEANVWTVSDTLDTDALTKFTAGELYYNVHTGTYASGEIRGQIEP